MIVGVLLHHGLDLPLSIDEVEVFLKGLEAYLSPVVDSPLLGADLRYLRTASMYNPNAAMPR